MNRTESVQATVLYCSNVFACWVTNGSLAYLLPAAATSIVPAVVGIGCAVLRANRTFKYIDCCKRGGSIEINILESFSFMMNLKLFICV